MRQCLMISRIWVPRMLAVAAVAAAVLLVGRAATAQEPREQDDGPAPGTERTFAGMEFVWCPPGSFELGSSLDPYDLATRFGGREEWYSDEVPRRTVTFRRGVWMSKYAVSKAEWERVMRTTPWVDTPGSAADLMSSPAVMVSWSDAERFMDALNNMGEGSFRLPNEEEWEYACRAGTTTPYYFGETADNIDDYAWHRGNTVQADRPHVQVRGQKEPNAWGLHDMLGNAWEWCGDAYAPYIARRSGRADEQEANELYRVVRGGCFALPAGVLRASYRMGQHVEKADPRTGFRIVREQ